MPGGTTPQQVDQDRSEAGSADDGLSGVKFDQTGQNILASTYLIQLSGKKYDLVWPETAANAKLQWPMASGAK